MDSISESLNSVILGEEETAKSKLKSFIKRECYKGQISLTYLDLEDLYQECFIVLIDLMKKGYNLQCHRNLIYTSLKNKIIDKIRAEGFEKRDTKRTILLREDIPQEKDYREAEVRKQEFEDNLTGTEKEIYREIQNPSKLTILLWRENISKKQKLHFHCKACNWKMTWKHSYLRNPLLCEETLIEVSNHTIEVFAQCPYCKQKIRWNSKTHVSAKVPAKVLISSLRIPYESYQLANQSMQEKAKKYLL